MSGQNLSESDRLRIACGLLEDRFGQTEFDPKHILPFVDEWLSFKPGYVGPDKPFFEVDGVGLAPPHLDHKMQTMVGKTPSRAWPGGAPMAIAVTHDVDLFDGLSYFGLRLGGWGVSVARHVLAGRLTHARDVIKRGQQWTRWWFQGHDPVADLGAWQALEAEYGIRSTFFFLAVERALSKEGRLYRADDPRVQQALRSLRNGGWDIGLHACRYDSEDALGLERQRIRLENASGGPIQAIRYHYLKLKFPEAWTHMHDAGFTISSNVGFNPPHQGFRTGTAWPYRPLAHRGSSLYEMPMGLMDVAHGPARPRLKEFFDRLSAEVREVGGLLVLNFHTNYQAEIDAPGVHAQFVEILKTIQMAVDAGQAVVLTLREVAEHMKNVRTLSAEQ